MRGQEQTGHVSTKTRRGELRIFLGAAPGVGKTFSVLGEAHRRRERGTDVVIGFVETHGRAKTADLVSDVTGQLDVYDIAGACASVRTYLEVLTNWYVRRSRDRHISSGQYPSSLPARKTAHAGAT